MNKGLVAVLVILVAVIVVGGVFTYNLLAEEDEKQIVTYDPGDVFLTNLKDNKSFIKVDLILEMENSDKLKSMTESNYKIRDTIITVLRMKSRSDMEKDDFIFTLKEDIKKRLETDIGIKGIMNVYFQELIVQ